MAEWIWTYALGIFLRRPRVRPGSTGSREDTP